MFFEDARDLTAPAVRLLESQRNELGCPDLRILPLREFAEFAASHKLTRSERETIVEQAILLIDQFYAHLPFKRARYAVDPVQSLRLIRAQLDDLSETEFHDHITRALTGLRDAHTFYGLPAPYRGALAFLPFHIRSFQEKTGRRRFIVTEILDGFEHARFNLNAEVVAWNGMPIEEAIEREAEHDPGGNPSSKFARGVNRICSRSLTLSVPPKSEFVVLEYLPGTGGHERHAIVLPWLVATNCIVGKGRHGLSSSINESMADLAAARSLLFRRAEMAPAQPEGVSKFPHVFAFDYSGEALRDPAHPEKKFGYIRIATFDLDSSDPGASDKFVEEFRRITALMQEVAPDGLIVDVRSNPGGAIDAAERILQCLTPYRIQPAHFHFISSRTTQQIARVLSRNKAHAATGHQKEWLPWIDDLLISATTGRLSTPGKPLTQPEHANDTGQIYQGPVTLIVDALAYSATDIFAAGFQDHAIGPVIGVDDNTGGGGANRWLHAELLQNLDLHGLRHLPLEPLPGGAQLGLAIRRSTRVATNAGSVLEDVGVKADLRHYSTRRDLLENDCDLIAFACGQLGRMTSYRLKIDKADLRADGIAVSVRTKNLFRVECLVNGLTQCAFSVGEGEQTRDFVVDTAGLLDAPETITMNGFAKVEDPVRGEVLRLVATEMRDCEQAGKASAV